MNIAIIGTGNVGQILARSAAGRRHSVTITSKDAGHLQEVAAATGALPVATSTEAVATADLVILAVPSDAVDGVLDDLQGQLDGKIVIDVTNRVNPADPGSVLDGTSNAERIQTRVPGARVVKAFNTAFAARQADPSVEGSPVDGYVAADNADAKEEVLDLVAAFGFRPIDVGPLAMARALEGMASLNILLQIRNGWPWQSAWKLVGPTGE